MPIGLDVLARSWSAPGAPWGRGARWRPSRGR